MLFPKDHLYTIATKRKEFFTTLLQSENINFLEAEILLFLHNNTEANTLTEIINAKDFAKSHVSVAISHLEKKGYLSKNTTPKNKKTQILTLLPKSELLIKQLNNCVEEFQQKAFKGISETEIAQMDKILTKICSNLKEEKEWKPS